ncbi:class I SAM-dependent methyltransferase [candidate division KSB1 bacterium]|nr:class I SAM-dependent methyltransferase [candidate division KSB1 bacterium]
MPSKSQESVKHVSVYSHIAPLYDYMMRHVNYVQWYRYIDSLLNAYAPNPRSLLELACGTGKMLEKFAGQVPVLMGLDRSFEMLQGARQRLSGKCDHLLLWNGDMRQFAIQIEVQVVLCLYDSINYCMSEDELTATLDSVNVCLQDGGVFIFDICTRRTCKNYFRSLHEVDTFAGTEFVRRGRYDDKNDWQINEFWLNQQETGSQYFERHVQKIYSLRAVKKSITRSQKWDILGVYNNFTRRPGSERSFRVHFVLQKRTG